MGENSVPRDFFVPDPASCRHTVLGSNVCGLRRCRHMRQGRTHVANPLSSRSIVSAESLRCEAGGKGGPSRRWAVLRAEHCQLQCEKKTSTTVSLQVSFLWLYYEATSLPESSTASRTPNSMARGHRHGPSSRTRTLHPAVSSYYTRHVPAQSFVSRGLHPVIPAMPAVTPASGGGTCRSPLI